MEQLEWMRDRERDKLQRASGDAARHLGTSAPNPSWNTYVLALPVYPDTTRRQTADGVFRFTLGVDALGSAPL